MFQTGSCSDQLFAGRTGRGSICFEDSIIEDGHSRLQAIAESRLVILVLVLAVVCVGGAATLLVEIFGGIPSMMISHSSSLWKKLLDFFT